MAGVATAADAAVAELAARKGGHASAGPGEWDQHRRHAVEVTGFARR